jgi:pyruvate/2-oxoglutarate dehydrogenase complex dihydrolipoamide dehydrogenase (E3) component
MTQTERVEFLILGSGAGGKLLAWEMASAGHRTTVVERKWIGGSCPNVNCLPSKNEVRSAEVADLVHRAEEFGTIAHGVRTDMASVYARKRAMVDELVARHLERYHASGAELILGQARFVAPKTVEVVLNDGGTRHLVGDRVFLNLGTRPSVPPVPGLVEAALTNIELLELDRLPERLVVVGGGYVAVEFAQAYRRFGSRVTLLERGPHLLAAEDADVAEGVQQLFADEGIEVLPNSTPLRVEGRRGELRVSVRTTSGERTIEATDILAATGRTPNTSGIGLEIAGVKVDERGFVAANDRLETSATDVWAVGDCAGSPQFTHVSVDDYRVIRDNLAGGHRSTLGRLVPFCVFTDPPLARVGMNEVEAKGRGLSPRIATLPIQEVLRTATTGNKRGFMKALVDAKSDAIVGFTMFGAEAGEVMAVVQTAMLAGLPYTSLRDAMFTHPTMTEGLSDLFARIRR